MFARVLYVDEEKSLELNWFGIGALQVRHKNGAIRRANALQKRAFYLTVSAFEKTGQPVHPSNPKCSRLMKDFADLMEHSVTSLTWQTVFSSTPEKIAAAYARGD